MRRFLQQLATSVLRPQPSLHPFAESIYPAPRASSNRPLESSEIVVGIPRLQPVATQLMASIHQPLTSATPRHAEAQPRPAEQVLSVPQDHALRDEQQHYRPLLPVRERQPSVAADVFAPLGQPKKEGSREEHEFAVRSSHEEEQAAATVSQSGRAPDSRDEHKAPRPIMPLLPHFETQAFVSPRRPVSPSAALAARLERETRADDIHINIGRIEVIAVPPAAPRQAQAPQRKGISLDDYLSRRNGRAG